MNARPGRYAVTPNRGSHDPERRFTVTCNGQPIGYAPTRYKARQLAGDHAEQQRRLGEWVASKVSEACEKRRAQLLAKLDER